MESPVDEVGGPGIMPPLFEGMLGPPVMPPVGPWGKPGPDGPDIGPPTDDPAPLAPPIGLP